MSSDLNTSDQRDAHTNPNETSMDPSIAAFATELDNKSQGAGGNLSSDGKPSSPDLSMQSSSVEDSDLSRDQRNAETGKQIDSFLPASSSVMDSRANKVITDLGRYRDSRIHHPSLLINDLNELGMAGELSEDNRFVTTSFEDLHRLVTTMKMAELILNDTVQSERKAKIAQIKVQLDARWTRPSMI